MNRKIKKKTEETKKRKVRAKNTIPTKRKGEKVLSIKKFIKFLCCYSLMQKINVETEN